LPLRPGLLALGLLRLLLAFIGIAVAVTAAAAAVARALDLVVVARLQVTITTTTTTPAASSTSITFHLAEVKAPRPDRHGVELVLPQARPLREAIVVDEEARADGSLDLVPGFVGPLLGPVRNFGHLSRQPLLVEAKLVKTSIFKPTMVVGASSG